VSYNGRLSNRLTFENFSSAAVGVSCLDGVLDKDTPVDTDATKENERCEGLGVVESLHDGACIYVYMTMYVYMTPCISSYTVYMTPYVL